MECRLYLYEDNEWLGVYPFILDVFAHAIVGWKVSKTINTDMVMVALNQEKQS